MNKNWVKEKSLRAALETPLARMPVDVRAQKGLLDGRWQLHLPVQASGSATVTGKPLVEMYMVDFGWESYNLWNQSVKIGPPEVPTNMSSGRPNLFLTYCIVGRPVRSS